MKVSIRLFAAVAAVCLVPALFAAETGPVLPEGSVVGRRPMTKTVWGQGTHDGTDEQYGGLPCYNYFMLSQVGETSSVRAPSGCIGTAGAQLLYFHRHPEKAVVRAYECQYFGVRRTLETSGEEYDWDAMEEDPEFRCSLSTRRAIGRLTADVGIACGTTYGAEVSGAEALPLARCLQDTFGYANARWFPYTTAEAFRRDIIPNLDSGHPVIIGIHNSAQETHAVVVDGYAWDPNGAFLLHVNMGWQGIATGWYEPPRFDYTLTYDGEKHEKTFDIIDGFVGNVFPRETGSLVSGRVTDAGGAPVAGARVELRRGMTVLKTFPATDAAGLYWFLAPTGSCTVVATSGAATAETSVLLGEDRNALADLSLAVAQKVATPTVRADAGKVSLACATAGATIRYTCDGTEPDAESEVYGGPFALSVAATVRARAYKAGFAASATAVSSVAGRAMPDDFADAWPIDSAAGRLTVDNSAATQEADELLHFGYNTNSLSLWFAFTPPATTDYVFQARAVRPVDGVPDPQLAVYTNSTLKTLRGVVRNDDVNGYERRSALVFSATAGLAYRIALDAYNHGGDGWGGEIELSWQPGDLAMLETPFVNGISAAGCVTSVVVNAQTAWRVVDRSDWIVPASEDGAGGMPLEFSVAANDTGEERQGVVFVQAGSSDPVAMYVTQDPGERRRRYDVVYAPGHYGTGAGYSAKKLAGEPVLLEDALFTRAGYVQTGWATNAVGQTREYALQAEYRADVDVVLYPYWERVEEAQWDPLAATAGTVEFEHLHLEADEGSNVTVRVWGGNPDRTSSVQVWLKHISTAAADIDVNKTIVAGKTAKKVTFPVTLKWAQGEIGEKTLVLRLKRDALAEGVESFVLQFGGELGLERGERRVCTVSVLDEGRCSLAGSYKNPKTTKGVAKCQVIVSSEDEAKGVAAGSGFFYKGAKLTVRAQAKAGFGFAGWYDRATGARVTTAASYAFKVTKPVALEARFARRCSLRALADPADGGTASGTGFYAPGQTVTLKAAKKSHFRFLGWYAASDEEPNRVDPDRLISTAATLSVPIETDRTVYARFESEPRLELFKTSGGSVSGANKYPVGKKVKLVAKPSKGYAFVGWRDADGKIVSIAPTSYYYMADGNDVYTALFKRESALARPVLTWAATNLTIGVKHSSKPTAAGEAQVKVANVTGLPKGLAWKSGKVTGVPAVTGRKTVTVKVTLVSNSKKYWTYKVPLVVSSLPAYVRGTFNGGRAEGSVTNQATVTVSSAGKVSGSVRYANAAWTLSASSIAGVTTDGVYKVSATAKKGKTKKSLAILIGRDELGGWATSGTSGFLFEARQNLWASDALRKAWAEELSGAVFTNATDALTVTFGAKAVAKAVVRSGRYSFSASSALVPQEIDEARLAGRIYLYFAPNTKKKFKGAMRVVEVGTVRSEEE